MRSRGRILEDVRSWGFAAAPYAPAFQPELHPSVQPSASSDTATLPTVTGEDL